MSKYEVGDKATIEIRGVNMSDYITEDYTRKRIYFDKKTLDGISEPIAAYIEPLERKNKNKQMEIEKLVGKMKRQAAEITRLVADNKRLKAENGNGLWNIEQARAEGQNEAWGLAMKIVLMEKEGGMKDEDYKAIFGGCQPSDYILKTHTYPEAAAKVEAWEKAKEMSVESAIGNLTALKHGYENENNEDERHFNIALGMAIKALKQIGEE